MPYNGRRPKRPHPGAPQHAWDAYAEAVRYYLRDWEPEDDADDYRPTVSGARGTQPEDIDTEPDYLAKLGPDARYETDRIVADRWADPPEGTDKSRSPESIFYRGKRRWTARRQ